MASRQSSWPASMALALLGSASGFLQAAGAPSSPFETEARIELGEVKGRIDHLAIDLPRRRLFVAELGNDSIAVVDLAHERLLRRLTDVREPQGVAFLPQLDRFYAASGADGTVHAYRGEALAADGVVDLGDDADNLRVDPAGQVLYSGNGSGALTALDPATLRVRGSVKLPGHPESFQLEARGGRVYVNVPDARSVVVVDRSSNSIVSTWPTGPRRANFPMALDEEGRRVFVAFRQPAWLQTYATDSGREGPGMAICGDADDLFFDRRRSRLYVICGEGFIDVLAVAGTGLTRVGRYDTARGARTGLYSPESDRLFIPVRGSGSKAVALWVIRPVD